MIPLGAMVWLAFVGCMLILLGALLSLGVVITPGMFCMGWGAVLLVLVTCILYDFWD